MKLALIGALSLATCGVAAAQAAAPGQVFPAKDVAAQNTALAEKAQKTGSAGATLGNYGSHNIQLSTRTSSGGAEVHKHFVDIFYVYSGTATLITGGEVVDAKENTETGEIKGKEIKDGKSQTLSAGDVVHIPAGTPHQLIIPQGSTYQALVVKVKEQ